MTTLRGGTRVEICPSRLGNQFTTYAALDGCQAVVVNLRGHGRTMEAKVNVATRAKDCITELDIPALALKPLAD